MWFTLFHVNVELFCIKKKPDITLNLWREILEQKVLQIYQAVVPRQYKELVWHSGPLSENFSDEMLLLSIL